MKKKILAACLVVCLLATAVIGTTLAYFTDSTQEEVNTFTVGKVDITLAESGWVNNSKLIPGETIAKKPTITVETGSEDAWVFAEFTVGADLLDLIEAEAGSTTTPVADLITKWFENPTTGFKVCKSEENPANGSYTYIIGFNDVKHAGDTIDLFTGVKVPETLTSEMLTGNNNGNLTLAIKAYAIQAENLASVDAAYTALFEQA